MEPASVVISVSIGFFLLLTGFLKTLDLSGFAAIVVQYGLVWRKIAKPLAYLQPFIEILGGSLLFASLSLRGLRIYGVLVALFVLLTANFFVLVSLIRKKKMDNCGCMGVAFKIPLDWKKFWQNNAYIMLVLFLLLTELL